MTTLPPDDARNDPGATPSAPPPGYAAAGRWAPAPAGQYAPDAGGYPPAAGDHGAPGAYYPGAQWGLPPAGLNSVAGAGPRLVARIVDGAIGGAIGFGLAPLLVGDGGLVMFVLVATLVGMVYEVGFLAARGATPGKMVLGLRVARVADGEKPGVGAALVRWAVPSVPAATQALALITLLDYLWLLWDRDKQCLHDKAAKTIVVRAK